MTVHAASSFGRRALSAALALVLAIGVLAVVADEAVAEFSPNVQPTWGVDDEVPGTTNPWSSEIWGMETIGDRLYVGGKFTTVTNGQTTLSQPYLAAFDAYSGDHIPGFAPTIDAPVFAVHASADGSKLIIGGEFTSAGAAGTKALAALDPITGAPIAGWDAGIDYPGNVAVVNALDVHANGVYAAGVFTSAGGSTAIRVAKVSATDGSRDTTFNGGAGGGSVWGISVAPDGSNVYVGGFFGNLNGQPNTRWFGGMSATTGVPIAGQPQYDVEVSNAYVLDVEAHGNFVWVAGSEHVISAYNLSDLSLARRHSTDFGGDYQDIEGIGDRVYASCHCFTNHYEDFNYWPNRGNPIPPSVTVTPADVVVAYDASTGGHIQSFLPDTSSQRSGAWAVTGGPDGCLWAGGDFTRAGNPGSSRTVYRMIKMCDEADLPAPQNVAATFVGDTSISLSWDAVHLSTSYEVFLDGVSAATSTSRFATIGGLNAGQTYAVTVTAINALDTSDPSAPIDVTTTGAVGVLPAPQNLTNTTVTKERAVLRYDIVPGASSYEILRDGVVVGNRTGRWYTDLNLAEGTTYTYEVRAIAADATPGDLSDPLDVTTLGNGGGGVLPAPDDLTNTYQSRERLVMRWNTVGGAASYEILRGGVVVGTSTGRYYTDLGLSSGTTYSYQVRAIAADGTPGTLSATISATTNP